MKRTRNTYSRNGPTSHLCMCIKSQPLPLSASRAPSILIPSTCSSLDMLLTTFRLLLLQLPLPRNLSLLIRKQTDKQTEYMKPLPSSCLLLDHLLPQSNIYLNTPFLTLTVGGLMNPMQSSLTGVNRNTCNTVLLLPLKCLYS